MAFNDYITIGSYKYKTLQRSWVPKLITPQTVRFTLQADIDATFSSGTVYLWEGEIVARVSPASGYGTPAQLEASLIQKSLWTFSDHYETSYNVTCKSIEKHNLIPDWSSNENEVYFTVQLQGVLA